MWQEIGKPKAYVVLIGLVLLLVDVAWGEEYACVRLVQDLETIPSRPSLRLAEHEEPVLEFRRRDYFRDGEARINDWLFRCRTENCSSISLCCGNPGCRHFDVLWEKFNAKKWASRDISARQRQIFGTGVRFEGEVWDERGGSTATTVLSWCRADDEGGCTNRVAKAELNHRKVVWGDYGWLVFTVSEFEKGEDESLSVVIAKMADQKYKDNTDPVWPRSFKTLGDQNAFARSKTRTGFLERDLALYAQNDSRARVIYQTGLQPNKNEAVVNVDDSLMVMDYCIRKEREKERIYPCSQSNVLPQHGGWEGSPAFSPDGKWIAYLRFDSEHKAGKETDESKQLDLWVVRNSQEVGDIDATAVNLTAHLDYPVVEYEWSCHSRCLIIKVHELAATVLYQADLAYARWQDSEVSDLSRWMPVLGSTRATQRVLAFEQSAYLKQFRSTPSGQTLFAVMTVMGSPFDTIRRCYRKLVHAKQRFVCQQRPVNDTGESKRERRGAISVRSLDTYKIQRASSRDSRAGVKNIQGYLFFPPCRNRSPRADCGYENPDNLPLSEKHQLLVYLHGGPNGVTFNRFNYLLYHLLRGSGLDDSQVQEHRGDERRRSFIVLALNPGGSDSFGEAYRRETTLRWGERSYQDVVNALDRMLGEPDRIDGALGRVAIERGVYIVGESYGAYLVNLLQAGGGKYGRPGVPIAGLISLYGVYNLATFPCKTDQHWFTQEQFGYSSNCSRNHALYKSDFDPMALIEKSGMSGSEFLPMLIVHGTRDKRVRIKQSQELAKTLWERGMNPYLDADPAMNAKFRVCQVIGPHGFDFPILKDIYLATMRWIECAEKGDSCMLHVEGEARTRVNCSVPMKSCWAYENCKRADPPSNEALDEANRAVSEN